MHERGDLRLLAIQKICGFGFGERFAPRLVEDHDVRAVALAHIDDALREIARGEYGKLLTGRDEVRERRFHACAARAGESMHELVLGAEQLAQRGADVFKLLEQKWIQMADDGLSHRLINAFGNLRRTGSE